MTPTSEKGKQPGEEEVSSLVREATASGETATINTTALGTDGSGATNIADRGGGDAKEGPPSVTEATDGGDTHEVPVDGKEDTPDLVTNTANSKPVQKRSRSPQPPPDVDTDNSLEIAMTHEQRIEMMARGEALRHVERAWKAQQRLVRRCMGLRMRSEQWQSAPSADGADGREAADTDPAAGTETAATETKSKERKDPAPTATYLGGHHEHRRHGPVQRKDKVPKGRGAYTLYQNMVRERFVMENPDLDWSKMTMKIGESWTRLTEEEKRPWKEKAEKENAGGKRESPPRGPRLFPPATEMKKLTGNKK